MLAKQLLATVAGYHRNADNNHKMQYWTFIDTYICCIIVTASSVLKGVGHKVILWTLVNVKPAEWNVNNDHAPTQNSNSMTSQC